MIANLEPKASLCYIYYHLERCGGSSVNSWFCPPLFVRNKNKHLVNHAAYNHTISSLIKAGQSLALQKYFMISGHFGPEALPGELFSGISSIISFTVIRDPVSRVLSAYALYLHKNEWWGRDGDAKDSFFAWAKRFPEYSENMVTKRFSHKRPVALEALSNMWASCNYIALTDSLDQLYSALNSKMLDVDTEIGLVRESRAINSTPKDYAMVNDDIINYILERNGEDMRLYSTILRMSRHGLVETSKC